MSTWDGHGATRRRTGARSWSISLRSRAGRIRGDWSPCRPCRTWPRAATEAALGVVTLEADTQVSLDERFVDLGHITISKSNFPSLSREQLREVVTQLVQDALPPEDRIIALDRVLENLDQSQVTARGVEGVKADPPRTFLSTGPAMLVILDGDPIWAPIEGLDLQFAVNTNWDLFQRTTSNATALYVRHEDVWMTAPALDGPWTPAGDLPDSFSNLPADDNWSGAREGRTFLGAESGATTYRACSPPPSRPS